MFFISPFLLCNPKFVIQGIFWKALFVRFFINLFFRNLDIGRSYERFSLPKSSYPRLVVLYSFLLLKNASWYPFKFLPSLILEPFISCFILRHFSIWRIWISLSYEQKLASHLTPLIVEPTIYGEPKIKRRWKKLFRLKIGYTQRSINSNILNYCVRKNPLKL